MNNITYMTGLLTFYLKGNISADQNFVRLKIPNTILSLIPLGAQKENIPVNQVASVSSNFRLQFKNLIVGIVEVILAFALFRSSALWGLILLIIGASTVITSFVTELYITTTGGQTFYVPFLIFEKAKAGQAESMINSIICGRLDDTNYRQVSETSTNPFVNEINNRH